MGYEKEELKEAAESVAFWLADENKQARKELEQRNPPLGRWLSTVGKRVQEKLAEHEAQEVAVKI